MAQYIFAPSPSFDISEHQFATYMNAFSPEEIEKIILYLETLEQVEGSIADKNEIDVGIRKSKIAWVNFSQETDWIFDRLAWVTRLLNGQFYKFDLFGFSEPLQYTTYHGEDHEHYTWHRDCGPGSGSTPPRKLSVILQLSDSSEYEGGDLEIFTGGQPNQIQKQKGMLAVFPSFVLHRVSPVTSGVRRSLVAWVSGPVFK